MRYIKTEDSIKIIPIDYFSICMLDGATKSKITNLYPKRCNGAYYLDKFENYLKDQHQISLKDYIKKYLTMEYPLCPTCNEELNFKKNGKGIVFSRYKKISKKTCANFSKGCEKLSKDRKGKDNPMYGKKPWNKGDKNFAKKISKMFKGYPKTEEHKKKLSESAKKRKVHGHTGFKHSEESKDKMRQATAKRYRQGKLLRETSIHIKTREYLDILNLNENYEEECFEKYFSIDFAFKNAKLAIEVQGTFFHIDPRVYPDGPVSAIQRRNFGRDKSKKKYLESKGWTILELWETEINNGEFKEILKCKLQELNLLKK